MKRQSEEREGKTKSEWLMLSCGNLMLVSMAAEELKKYKEKFSYAARNGKDAKNLVAYTTAKKEAEEAIKEVLVEYSGSDDRKAARRFADHLMENYLSVRQMLEELGNVPDDFKDLPVAYLREFGDARVSSDVKKICADIDKDAENGLMVAQALMNYYDNGRLV